MDDMMSIIDHANANPSISKAPTHTNTDYNMHAAGEILTYLIVPFF
jgi:hypothetical protein